MEINKISAVDLGIYKQLIEDLIKVAADADLDGKDISFLENKLDKINQEILNRIALI
jgi:hypothetical protein